MRMLSVISLALVIMLAAPATSIVRATGPAAAPATGPKKVTLPPYDEYTLENGLTVCVMETHELPLVTVSLLIPAGSVHDIPGKEGIANLTARMLLKGAAGRTAEQIAESIEGIGGTLEAEASRDYTIVAGDFMARDLGTALDLLGDVVLRPDFPGVEHEREKSIVSAEIKSAKENMYSYAMKQFVRVLCGDHPYAHQVEGNERGLAAIAREEVAAFHGEHYSPAGAILAVVGDIDAKKTAKMVKERFGGWKGTAAGRSVEKLADKRFPGRRIVVIDNTDATQSQIRIGNVGAARNSPDYFPLRVANNILGGGFTSRLMREIRVVRGLSYGAYSDAFHLKQGGIFVVTTYTKNETLREAIDVALAELENIRTVTVDDEELESVERYISGLFPFQLETNSQLAHWLTELSFYDLDKGLVENYRSEIDAVTGAEVREVAQRYFHLDDCLILLITNYEAVKDQLEGLGQVEVIPFDEVE